MKSTTLLMSALAGAVCVIAAPAPAAPGVPVCTMGIDVADNTVANGGGHSQGCTATIWDQDDVTKDPVARTQMADCTEGSTAQVKWGGWNYNFKLNKHVGPSGKLGDGDAEVAREYIGASVPFNEHYSHTDFGAFAITITNIAYAKVDCPVK